MRTLILHVTEYLAQGKKLEKIYSRLVAVPPACDSGCSFKWQALGKDMHVSGFLRGGPRKYCWEKGKVKQKERKKIKIMF